MSEIPVLMRIADRIVAAYPLLGYEFAYEQAKAVVEGLEEMGLSVVFTDWRHDPMTQFTADPTIAWGDFLARMSQRTPWRDE